jgi:phosphoenolpyruvate carboxykinase (GTP)
MYVLAFSMGPIGSAMSQIGVQFTDSPYAVVNMRIMARIGLPVFKQIDADSKRVVPCVHSVVWNGAPGARRSSGMRSSSSRCTTIFPTR